MKKLSRCYLRLFIFTFIFYSSCASENLIKKPVLEVEPLNYEVDLNDRSDDLFKVRLLVNDLTSENAIYQFAATAPGTYQVMDIGRFVREFEAIDKSGNIIATKQISTNQWQILSPEKVHEIRYAIAETWDTPVDSNKIFMMAGTSMEKDHVLLLGHCVFGFPTGMQTRPMKIKLLYPEQWKSGTALYRDKDGYFYAENYDHMVDSPLLLGRLSLAKLRVNGSKVQVYTYSKTDRVKSKEILNSIEDVLLASADFMNGLPVEHYTFLFHFEDVTMGAWEHSYSSNYVYSEAQFEEYLASSLPEVIAHEFFHIVTPLNIHSEIIEQFNFVEPVPSEHLWLYEGVTEWACHKMQLNAGLTDLNSYLEELSNKLKTAEYFTGNYSLKELALKSYTEAGQQEYGNIYMKGAVIAGLLDIRIFELSDGEKGLREVINLLSRIYGPKKAFSEKDFYNTFTNLTYPEIADFFEKYVRNNEHLPIAEYYAKLGIKYTPEVKTGEEITAIGYTLIAPQGELKFSKVETALQKFGLHDDDVLLAYNDTAVDLKNLNSVFRELQNLDAGVPYKLTINREGTSDTITCEKIRKEKINRHVFEVDPNATVEQNNLRNAWLKLEKTEAKQIIGINAD